MSISNLQFLTIFSILASSPLFVIFTSGKEISTVVFNAKRMTEIIDHFMSSNITEDDLFSSSSSFETSSSSKSFTIPIFNKELLTKSQFKDHESLVQSRIRNDISRIKKLTAEASLFEIDQVNPNDYDVPYFGFLSELDGAYIVAFKVGNPLFRQLLVLDTGSELTWWNCNPCKNCIKNSLLYDPRRSSTNKTVTCDDPICEEHKFACRYVDHNCAYKINYADNGYTMGEVAYERLSTTTGTVMLDRMVFGCSRKIAGRKEQDKGKVTGVLGFNRGKYSLLSQMNAQNFTVCLPAHYGQGKNELRIHVLPPYYYPDSITVPLMDNALKPSFYVGINGISVGGERVNVPDDAWNILPNGKGGTIIDLGTFLTWLRSDIFHPFNELFIKKAAALGLPVVRIPEGIFRSCFKMTTPTSTNIPSVEFNFQGIYVTYKLGPEHIMIQVGDSGYYCLAFAEETGLSFSLIGNWQLQKTRLAFDIANEGLNIDPNFCD